MSTSQHVILTGAGSFTGIFIADALKRAGFEVLAPITRLTTDYLGLKAQRLERLKSHARVFENAAFDSKGFLAMASASPAETLILHHHFMENWRSPSYDREAMRRMMIAPLDQVLGKLQDVGLKHVIYSGTIMEPGEGGAMAAPPYTPYGESKREVWEALHRECERKSLNLSKIVIPNPFGPFENEDRLAPLVIAQAKRREPLLLKNPHATSDNIPVRALARVYADTVRSPKVIRPSAWVATAEEFARVFEREVVRPSIGPCEIQVIENPPAARVIRNSDAVAYDLSEVWREYREFLLKN